MSFSSLILLDKMISKFTSSFKEDCSFSIKEKDGDFIVLKDDFKLDLNKYSILLDDKKEYIFLNKGKYVYSISEVKKMIQVVSNSLNKRSNSKITLEWENGSY